MSRAWWIVAGLLVAGCGSGEELDSENAAVAWEATQKALSGGESGQAGALVGSSWTYDCPDGGTAKWEYEVDANIGGFDDVDPIGTSTDVSAKYSVFFKRCVVDGVKITGDLAYDVSVQADSGSATTQWSYTGDLVYKGELNGSCIIDMEGSASASQAGASITYSGTVCGNDAAETLNVDYGAE